MDIVFKVLLLVIGVPYIALTLVLEWWFFDYIIKKRLRGYSSFPNYVVYRTGKLLRRCTYGL